MQNPPGTAGHGWLVKVGSRTARPASGECPTHRYTAVRPLLTADPCPPFRPAPLEEFGLGPLWAALDRWEHDGQPLDRVLEEVRRAQGPLWGRSTSAHPALLAWTAEALERYAAARTAEQGTARAHGLPLTAPVRFGWTVRTRRMLALDARGAGQYEHTVWGRQYTSADGSVRDLWLPSLGSAKPDRAAAEKAAIAHVVLNGMPARRRRRDALPPETATEPARLPDRVRVFDFGCADGSVTRLLDWGPEETREKFAAHAAPVFHAVATGSGTRPGPSCVECKAISRCDPLRRTPGLWGGSPTVPARSRRSVSAWDLRLHSECPAQYHLVRRLHLDGLVPESDGARRGRVVDAWLNARHATRPVRGCRDLAASETAELPVGHGLDAPLAQAAVRMLEEHRSLCPLNGLTPDEQVRVQPRVTAYVPELDVVVLAVPDLIYTHRGRWIWRETKTAASALWEGRSLLRSYPQLALGVLLLAAGALGADRQVSHMEFELLREGRGESHLERIDPGRAAIVAEAREVVASLAQPLLDDTEYEPRTGRHCHGCQARRWCKPGSAYAADHPAGAGRRPRTGQADPADARGPARA
ncbi:PD-(D/E)XK nuclease family protein [Streptomyces sp. NPDC127112]|uniref:PD-(D/E)XK nuclease family protein n=1 Tax=Streptomyces sp. NPDC127112 TaxID=3345364 RepID=UPI00363AD9ED